MVSVSGCSGTLRHTATQAACLPAIQSNYLIGNESRSDARDGHGRRATRLQAMPQRIGHPERGFGGLAREPTRMGSRAPICDRRGISGRS